MRIKSGTSNEDRIFDGVNTILMLIVLIVTVYPLYFVLIASFSDPYAVASGQVTLLPIGISLEAYGHVIKNMDVWIGYRNTILYTVFATLFGLFLTIPSAYVLSKKHLPGVGVLTWLFVFIMYFSGGLIPTYLLVRDLGLFDKPYTLVIIGAFSVFNLLITRSYFANSIPESLFEAAHIDGASEFTIFARIALPLAGPITAVIALYYGVSHWNSFFNALIFINSKELMPLQIILRNILIQNQTALQFIDQGITDDELSAIAHLAYLAETMKYSLIIIAIMPLLMIYPFVQKFFVKGVLIGSIKG